MSDSKKEILLGNCLELMKDIPNGSIDMILCDLPYGTTACKWDIIIPFEPLWEQYKRIIKDNGAIVLFGSEPFSSHLRMSNIKNYKYDWVWYKSTVSGIATANYIPMKAHELISVFYIKAPTYNKQQTERRQSQESKNRLKYEMNGMYKTNHYKNMKRVKKLYNDTYCNPRSVLEFKSVYNANKKLHSTQKPVALFEYLIKTYTNEGDLVLDNCAGSGTTAIACLNTNRQFIVMEKEDKYYEVIKKRVEDFSINLKIFAIWVE